MINLLPGTIKEQLRYAKLNRVVIRYLRLLGGIIMLLAATFGASIYFLTLQANAITHDVAGKQKEIGAFAADEKKAREVAERLTAIKAIQSQQTRFSLLLEDLAKVLPQGVTIDSITLTGDDKKPVRVTVTGTTYDAMLTFRESLAASARISGVDLENITQSGPIFQSSVVIGFKPGQAR